MEQNNPNNKSFGLVIHGKIESNLKTYGQKFDSNKSIEYILKNYSNLFKKIVISTWKDERKNIKLNSIDLEKVDFVFSDDPGQPLLHSGDSSDNRLRQYLASLKGLEHIKNDVDYVIKIRADLQVDCSKCVNFFFKEIQRKKNLLKENFKGLICGFEFWVNRPYALKDLLYIGTKKELEDFFRSQVYLKNYRFAPWHNRDWPEGDSIRKYLYYIKENLEQFKEEQFFSILPKKLKWSNAIYYEDEFDLWQYSLKNYFSALPHQIRNTCEFKGRKFKDFESSYFEGDDHDVFIQAEEDYVQLIKDYSNKTKSYMISKKRYFDFNPNYFKRKAENIFKKKNIITIVLDCILKIYFK